MVQNGVSVVHAVPDRSHVERKAVRLDAHPASVPLPGGHGVAEQDRSARHADVARRPVLPSHIQSQLRAPRHRHRLAEGHRDLDRFSRCVAADRSDRDAAYKRRRRSRHSRRDPCTARRLSAGDGGRHLVGVCRSGGHAGIGVLERAEVCGEGFQGGPVVPGQDIGHARGRHPVGHHRRCPGQGHLGHSRRCRRHQGRPFPKLVAELVPHRLIVLQHRLQRGILRAGPEGPGVVTPVVRIDIHVPAPVDPAVACGRLQLRRRSGRPVCPGRLPRGARIPVAGGDGARYFGTWERVSDQPGAACYMACRIAGGDFPGVITGQPSTTGRTLDTARCVAGGDHCLVPERLPVHADQTTHARLPGHRTCRVAATDQFALVVAGQPADVSVPLDRPRGMAGDDEAGVVTYQPAGPRTQPKSDDHKDAGSKYRRRFHAPDHRGATGAEDGSQIGPDQPADMQFSGHPSRGPDIADNAPVVPDQTADRLLTGHVHVDQREVADGAGQFDPAEEPRVVATVDEEVGDGMSVALKRCAEGPDQRREELELGQAEGNPSFSVVPVGIARVGIAAPVGVEVEVLLQLIPRAALKTAAHPVEGRGECGRIRGRVVRSVRDAVAVQVVVDGIELRQRVDLDQPVPVRVVVVPHRHREPLGRARVRSGGVGGRYGDPRPARDPGCDRHLRSRPAHRGDR